MYILSRCIKILNTTPNPTSKPSYTTYKYTTTNINYGTKNIPRTAVKPGITEKLGIRRKASEIRWMRIFAPERIQIR